MKIQELTAYGTDFKLLIIQRCINRHNGYVTNPIFPGMAMADPNETDEDADEVLYDGEESSSD